MEKSKKLRLKRKIPQQKSCVASEVLQQNQNEIETVTLSSDSECDNGPLSKQRKNLDQQTGSDEKGFLHTNNPSLNKLREMILSLSSQDVKYDNLSPFPAFNELVQESEDRQKDRTNLVKGRLQPVAHLQSEEVLSPFPKLCKHFRKSSREKKNGLSNEINIEGSGTNTESSNSLNIQGKHYGGSLNSTEFNDRECKLVQNNKETAHSEQVGTNRPIKALPSHIGEYREENSSIIRDRNSNYYALQSQNTDRRPERKTFEPVESNNTINDKLSTLKRVPRKLEKEEVCELVKSGNAVVNESSSRKNKPLNTNIPSQRSIKVSESKKYQTESGDTRLQDKSASRFTRLPHTSSNIDKNIRGKTNASAMLQKNHTSSISDTCLSKGDEMFRERTQGGVALQNNITTGIPHTSSSKGGENVRQVTQDKVVPQKKDTTSIPPANSSKEEDARAENKESVTLQSCPLCQMKFESRIGQMELDSHIAACLSTSEDDVIW